MRALLRRLWARRRWRWAIILALPTMVVIGILNVELTSTSTFCGTCHIMQPFHETWQASTHKDVACVECHIPPGLPNLFSAKLNGFGQMIDNTLGRTGTLPSAHVSDASCTREGCHDLPAVRALPRRDKPYFFDHAKHLDLDYQGIAVRCTTCHSHTSGTKHFDVNSGVCVTCHLLRPNSAAPLRQLAAAEGGTPAVRQVAFTASEAAPAQPVLVALDPVVGAAKTATNLCRDCHQPPAQAIQYRGLKVVHAEYLAYGAACESCHRGATAAADPIGDERCLACHDFGRERMTTVAELHRDHTAKSRHKVECFSCHGIVRHGPGAQAMRVETLECRTCHQGQHQIQQQIYEFPGALAASHPAAEGSAVTPMFLAHVDCAGCHVEPRGTTSRPASGATVAQATAAACAKCHKPGLGEQMIPLWQKNTRSLYASVERMLPDTSKPPPSRRAEQLIAEARGLLALVRLDGSWGVHNPPYTQKLIEQARARIIEASASGVAASASATATP